MHIMKLECLAKIPFGLYAELERSNSLLTEINTADGDQCLESLKVGISFNMGHFKCCLLLLIDIKSVYIKYTYCNILNDCI